MSTSNTTRSTKTKAGGPNHKTISDNLQFELASVRRQLAARKEENKSLHNEIAASGDRNLQLRIDNEQLEVEACRSINNLQERNYYKRSARAWFACSVIMAVSLIVLAVSL